LKKSKVQFIKFAVSGLLLGLTTMGIATQAQAAKVSPESKVKTTVKVNEMMRVKTSSTTATSKITAAFWNYPYGSNKAAKKTHWVKNYANKTLIATKQATLKNGLKYYYVKVASKPSVQGWVYTKWLRQMSMVSLGDSITKGWTGVDYATTPYPKQVGETLGMTSTNLGENNGKVVGSSSLDLTYNIDNHNFDKDDVATISYGVNDYFHDLSLMSVQSTLDQELTELQAQYPNLQIFGLLPLNCYVADATTGEYVSAATTMYKDHAYTLNDLRDMEAEVYKAHNIKVLDWRDYEGTIIPTDDARMTVFGDQRLHPTQATYTEMSGYISDFLQNNIK
jgi:hypothetical protein